MFKNNYLANIHFLFKITPVLEAVGGPSVNLPRAAVSFLICWTCDRGHIM